MMVKARFADRMHVFFPRAGRILLALCLLISGAASAEATTAATDGPDEVQGHSQPAPTHLVIENAGQYATEARFLLKQGTRSIWLTEDAVWLTVPDPVAPGEPVAAAHRGRQPAVAARSGTAIRFTFPGASAKTVLEPYGRVSTHVSYLIGSDPARWHRSVPVWSGVRYRDLYPGIDLVIGGKATGAVPWRLEARPGADLGAVTLRAEGADAVAAETGQLRLETKGRTLDLALPAWSLAGQTDLLESTAVQQQTGDGAFTILPELQVQSGLAAAVSASDAADASDLVYSTPLGGLAPDTGYGIAVDILGNAYITGLTRSDDFPVTFGSYDITNNGIDELAEAFVLKLNAAGTAPVYATYLGGAGPDMGLGIAVDGNLAYVVGETDSTDFPGAPKAVLDGSDIFVAALNANGSDVRYVTRLGGEGTDSGADIAVEGTEAYIVGSSSSTNLPGATGCTSDGDTNLVVAKLNASGARVYTTCLGGSDCEGGYGIAVRKGMAYVTGESQSTDFPGGLSSIAGDLLVARFDANGTKDLATLVGGSAADWGADIAVDNSGNVYVAGSTWSATDFPVTPGARPWGGPSVDAVVLKLLPDFTINFATYLGGDGDDYGSGITVDTVQALYVSGTTNSANFPVTLGAYNTNLNGQNDIFVARMHMSSSAPSKVTYATYLGDTQYDWGLGVATDTGGHAFVTGNTAYRYVPSLVDAFIAKVKVSSPPDAPVLTIAANGASAILSWNTVGQADRYQILRSSAPYFKAGEWSPGDWSNSLPEPSASPYSDNGVLSQVNAYFYMVKAVSAAPEQAGASSNRVAKFTYQLVKGN